MAQYQQRHWEPLFDGPTRASRKGGVYTPYVPDPLMGREWILSGQTAADIADAELAIARLDAACTALRESESLARLILRAEAISSSKIEGLVVGPRRILKAELAEDGRDALAEEVLGNITAMDKALASAAAEDTVSTDVICGIHRALMEHSPQPEFAGLVRSQQNWLGGNNYNPVGATYVPPAPEYVPDLLADLAAFCNTDDLSPLAQAAVVHAQFETVHPFVDGNGRTGRALVHLILRRRGLAQQVLVPISLAMATRAQRYVHALGEFRHVGAPNTAAALQGLWSWLSFFAECALHACNNAWEFERRMQQVQADWRSKLPSRLGDTAEELLSALVKQPVFTVNTLLRVMDKSRPSVNAAVAQFEKAGVIRQVNVGKRNRAFEATGIVDAFIGFERDLGSVADDTAIAKPARPVPFRPA